MNLLLKVFADIAFFRRGPEDLPASSFLFLASLLAYAAGSVLTSTVHTDGAVLILFQVVADVSLMLIWFGSLLVLYHRHARLQQTLTALFGTGALLYLAAFFVGSVMQSQGDAAAGAQPLGILLLVIWMWSVAVMGHIVHRALDIRLSLGMLIGISYLFSSVAVFSLLPGGNA